MEALQFLKFWKSTALTKDHHRPSSAAATEYYEFSDEEDDSFFELELTAPDLDNSNRFCNGNLSLHCDSDLKFQPQSNDKRKILPIESPPKAQSPISLLKSAPKFRVLMFKKSKSDSALENKVVTVELKLNEAPNLTRDNSLRRHIAEESLSEDSSNNFSKYLKLIKFKAAGKQTEKSRFSGGSSASSPSSSPAASLPKKDKLGSFPAGTRGARKQLGKSKSAPCPAAAAAAVASPAAETDGIQSAILHCKRSFNSSSSRDSSLLSRFASDPLVVSQRMSDENEIRVAQ